MSWWIGECCRPGGVLAWGAPDGVLAVAVVVALGVLALAARPWSGGGRDGELVLLALALAGATWMVLDPRWVEEGEHLEEGRRVVLVDASRSMGVREADGRTRLEAALALVDRMPGAEVYTFGSRLRAGAPTGADDPDTDLGGALDAIRARYAGERLASLVVVTDGADRGGLRRALIEAPDTAAPVVGGPVTLYQVGSPGARADLAVADLRAGGFAFLRAPFRLEVDVRVTGLARREVPVALTRDGQPVSTVTASLDATGRGTAVFNVRPEAPGRFLYEASVPLLQDDAIPANNSQSVAVRVVRDRIRILQVCGSPSWDQKFLRLFLKDDPAVDLVSFFILRTDRDMGSGYDNAELSLIGFPYERLFSSELETFDLVLLQNFDYAPYFRFGAEELLQNLAEFVRRGGALAMIGGDRSFDLGRYGGTPIADVLPVKLGVTGVPVDEARFRPQLTDAGRRHPITRLVPELEENAAIWTSLPELDGLNLTNGPADGAAVLLERAGQPVLAVRAVGAGRTMALTVDSSWRWSFTEAATGRGNQTYLRFWKNSLRWLLGDPEDQPVVVEVGRENYRRGEEGQAVVTARDVGFAPLQGASVQVEVIGPGGRMPLEGVLGADGTWAFPVPTGDRGPHRVKARVIADGRAVGAAETVYAVTTRDPELDEVDPDPTFLAALAARVGGVYVPAGEWRAPVEDPDAGRRVVDKRVTPLGGMPIVVALVLLSATGSWYLRRRAGRR